MDNSHINSYYNLYVYVRNIPQDIGVVTDYMIYANWFNSKLRNEENVSVTLYCNISLIGQRFYCVYYIKVLKHKFIHFEYSKWIKQEVVILNEDKTKLTNSIKLVNRNIKNYKNNVSKKQKSIFKDSIFETKIYGSNRYGIEKENVNIDITTFLSSIPNKINDKDLYLYRTDTNMIINNVLTVNYHIPGKLSTKQIENDNSKHHNLTTISFYFKKNNKIAKFICGPLLQGYLTQYGHSLLFKNLRIKKYQLYHFESIFDQETNLLFLQFVAEQKDIEEVKEVIIESIQNIRINEETFLKMKLFLSNEYRFKFSSSFGYFNYILNIGQHHDSMKDIFKLIDNLSIGDFKIFLKSKEIIKNE